MEDVKHLGQRCIDTPLHSPAWAQALVATAAFAAGVLVNQWFTDKYVAHASAELRQARAEAAQTCLITVQSDIDEVTE